MKDNNVEFEDYSPKNTLYEIGNTVLLYNPSDTVVAIYRDQSLNSMKNLFTNGIKATISDYDVHTSKSASYKIRIHLEDDSKYTGWVPEGMVEKRSSKYYR